jgi:hypothetical protein
MGEFAPYTWSFVSKTVCLEEVVELQVALDVYEDVNLAFVSAFVQLSWEVDMVAVI